MSTHARIYSASACAGSSLRTGLPCMVRDSCLHAWSRTPSIPSILAAGVVYRARTVKRPIYTRNSAYRGRQAASAWQTSAANTPCYGAKLPRSGKSAPLISSSRARLPVLGRIAPPNPFSTASSCQSLANQYHRDRSLWSQAAKHWQVSTIRTLQQCQAASAWQHSTAGMPPSRIPPATLHVDSATSYPHPAINTQNP